MVDGGKEEPTPVAVAYTVVRGEGGSDGRSSAEQPALGPRPFGDLSEADEGNLRRVDHPKDLIHAEIPKVGDRDGGIANLRAPQPTDASPRHEITQCHHELIEPDPGRVVDGRCDHPTAPQRDGHTDVHSCARLELPVDHE